MFSIAFHINCVLDVLADGSVHTAHAVSLDINPKFVWRLRNVKNDDDDADAGVDWKLGPAIS